MDLHWITVGLAGAIGGVASSAWARSVARRKEARGGAWHRRIAALAVRPEPREGQGASGPGLRAAASSGSAIVLAAALALMQPWGPLPKPMALSLGLLGGALVSLGTGTLASFRQRARLKELFPDWLSFLAAAMELGLPFAQALGVAAAAVDPPLREAAEMLAAGLSHGEDATACLARFAKAVGTQEAQFVTGILARHEKLGTPVASVLIEEEGLLSRLKAQERRTRQGLLPYAFTASAGVLLVNGVLLFVVPRAAALLANFRLPAA